MIFGTVVFTGCVHRYQTKGRATAHTAGRVRVNGTGRVRVNGGGEGVSCKTTDLGYFKSVLYGFSGCSRISSQQLKKKEKKKVCLLAPDCV